jgi:UDP-N-acetylglucosamine 2-epimerase (non-hydrolysing)
MKILSVAGARPNFMKLAPIHKEFLRHQSRVNHLICHTGQHFDENMSKVFFADLELPRPDYYLGVGSGSHAEQTGRIMTAFEDVLQKERPDLVLVVGDVNSTLACSLVAAKMGVKIAHVEAGLRSFDRTMPEEINRMLTDSLSDFLFVTEKSGIENLKREGIVESKIFFVGNVMIDSLLCYLPKTHRSEILINFGLSPERYVLVTLHRPSNVDSEKSLKNVVNFLNEVAEERKVIFPIHPRTRKNLIDCKLLNTFNGRVKLSDPIGYIDFLALMKSAEVVVTDSGGIQEETTFLGIPCITVRDSTERPVTVEIGTNQVVGTDLNKALEAVFSILKGEAKNGDVPLLWDGKAAERIVGIILQKL